MGDADKISWLPVQQAVTGDMGILHVLFLLHICILFSINYSHCCS